MRRHHLSILGLAALAVMAGCESSTDLATVSAGGQWDRAAPAEMSYPEVRLRLVQNENGAITGCWAQAASCNVQSANVVGTNVNGDITLQFIGFPAANATFEGRFTNAYRLEGRLQGTNLNDPAVFRRIQF